MANLYGFGRLAWNPDLSSAADRRRMDAADVRQRLRWSSTRSSTCCCARGRSTRATPARSASARSPTSSTSTSARRRSRREYNGWGQWHRANETGVGMDRTVATGTGFIGQYRPPVAAMFESLDNLPRRFAAVHAPRAVHARAAERQDGDSALLRRALPGRGGRRDGWSTSGSGCRAASTSSGIDEVLDRLEYQAGHAQVWRDAICRWFMRALRHSR